MDIQLSDHFTYKRLIKFVIPSIVMMIFTSIYGVVDGLFVSNFAGTTAFAAVNLVIPFTMILGAFGFMFGTGGSALVAMTLGQGKQELANKIFSFLIYTALIFGSILAILGIIFLEPIMVLLGAEGEMVGLCVTYGRIILVAIPAFMLQNMFQSFMVTAERPDLGLKVTIMAGVTNMILDALFIGLFKWGVAGAALATGISQFVGGIVPLVFFARKNETMLKLTKTRFMGRELVKSCTNGASELITNISMSLVSMLYNLQLIKIAGENGIAAYGVIMYLNFVFVAIFLGYAIGTAPIFGFNYGAANHAELKNVFKKSLIINTVFGGVLATTAIFLAEPLSRIFVGYDQELLDMTVRGMRLFSISFYLCGYPIFGSSFFTAMNNGLVSGIISASRTVVFQVGAVMILPMFWGLDGIWHSINVAEAGATLVTVYFLVKNRKKYKYV